MATVDTVLLLAVLFGVVAIFLLKQAGEIVGRLLSLALSAGLFIVAVYYVVGWSRLAAATQVEGLGVLDQLAQRLMALVRYLWQRVGS